jgi:hypothetical protein
LLGEAGTSDVVDAALALLTVDGDEIITSDLDNVESLVAAAGRHVEVLRP